MADRVVKVSLTAQVSNYVAGMEQARSATAKARDASVDAKAKFEEQNRAMTEVGQGLIAVGALALIGVGLAVKKFADFDAAMSNVKAATQESAENMVQLRQAALEFGASSVFTAEEAANAIEELGKAGLSTADILGGALEGSLNLASAGELGIARAAEIASITLSQFGLAGSEASRVADVLAAGAGKALGSVDDLANALKFVGPIANSMGISLEETTGVLAMFAQQGIIGEQAGTSLRGMLSSLTSPSSMARKEIEGLGITLYDSRGGFLGLENAAGQLSKAYAGMTDEQRDASLGVLFGNQQITAARVLYQGGAKDVAKWTGAVNDTGFAAKVAADRLDNLHGDIEKLGGAFDTALIRSGSAANDTLRGLTQSATFLVDAIGEMPAPVLGTTLAITAIGGAIALTGGIALVTVPKIAQYKLALDTLNVSAKSAGLAVGIAGSALAIATVGIGIWVGEQAKAKAAADSLATTLDKQTSAITRGTREMIKENLAAKQSWWFIEGSSTFDAAEQLGVSLDLVTDAASGNVDAIRALAKELDIGSAGSDKLKETMDRTGLSATELASAVGYVTAGVAGESKSLAEAIRITEQKNKVTDEGTGITNGAADAYLAAADEASGLNDKMRDLIDTINEANGVGQDAVSKNASYQQSLADVREAVAEYTAAHGVSTAALDESTVAGSTNAAMLAEMAGKSQAAAKAALDAGGSSADYTKALEDGRQAIYDTALGLTGNADAAQKLADKIYAMPTPEQIKFIVDTASAQNQLDKFFTLNSGRKIYAHVEGSLRGGFATGGYTGDAPATAPVGFVHGREFVSTARTTADPDNRRALEFMHRGGKIRGYAAGGYVQPTYVQAPRYVGGGGSTVNRQGDTFYISTPSDPVGTAQAVSRRQNMLGAV